MFYFLLLFVNNVAMTNMIGASLRTVIGSQELSYISKI